MARLMAFSNAIISMGIAVPRSGGKETLDRQKETHRLGNCFGTGNAFEGFACVPEISEVRTISDLIRCIRLITAPSLS